MKLRHKMFCKFKLTELTFIAIWLNYTFVKFGKYNIYLIIPTHLNIKYRIITTLLFENNIFLIIIYFL